MTATVGAREVTGFSVVRTVQASVSRLAT